MLKLDTSRPLRGYTQLTSLLEAIYNARPEDESDWVEWKGQWDFSNNAGRGHVARHVLGMANRIPDVAARTVGGCGYIALGVEPGKAKEVTPVDLATLEPQIRAFLGEDGPTWDLRWLTYKGTDVAVVIVDPPSDGDPVFTLRKELERGNGGSYPDGTVFVRRKGATHTANSHELEQLVRRAHPREASDRLDVELVAGKGQLSVIPLDISELAVDRWIGKERKRLLAPLRAEQRPEPVGGLSTSDPLPTSAFSSPAMAGLSRLARQMAGHFGQPEDRTPEAYEEQIETYLKKAKGAVSGAAINRHIESGACLLQFALRNPTDHPWREVLTELYIAGDGFKALDGPDYHNAIPRPPRLWGPRPFDYLGGIAPGDLVRPTYDFLGTSPNSGLSGPWVEIDNSGSARLRFSSVNLPPRSTRELMDFHLWVHPDLAGRRLSGSWEARSTHASGVAEGTVEIEISDSPVAADDLIAESD